MITLPLPVGAHVHDAKSNWWFNSAAHTLRIYCRTAARTLRIYCRIELSISLWGKIYKVLAILCRSILIRFWESALIYTDLNLHSYMHDAPVSIQGTHIVYNNNQQLQVIGSCSVYKIIYTIHHHHHQIFKEYSVILTSFQGIYQKSWTKKAYFQNFNWFHFYNFKLCMIMCVSLLP